MKKQFGAEKIPINKYRGIPGSLIFNFSDYPIIFDDDTLYNRLRILNPPNTDGELTTITISEKRDISQIYSGNGNLINFYINEK